jgi:NAD(P)-dependent dehydrogenase (short-subunit alcohol dehydrogenase family)
MSAILITGAARGIGRATALAAIGVYDKIYTMDSDTDAGIMTSGTIKHHGGNVMFMQCDISDSAALAGAMGYIKATTGLTVAVNCAGILGKKVQVGAYPEKDWRRVLDVNLTGTFLCMQHELNMGVTSIINISSVITNRPGDHYVSAYSVSKAGIDMLTKWVAMEYLDVFVAAVCPTDQDTTMNRELTGQYYDDYEHVQRLGDLGELIVRMTKLDYLDADCGEKLSGRVLHQDEWTRLMDKRGM